MNDPQRPYGVLFLCTGNSARSVLAEALINHLGAGRFAGYSAGSFPKGAINPGTFPILKSLGYAPGEFRSKSWDEFAKPGAPPIDFVITVCDNAAGEICPIWPGHPMTAHWGIPDPAEVEGDAETVSRAFNEAARQLTNQIRLFLALPLETLDKLALQKKVRDIGTSGS